MTQFLAPPTNALALAGFVLGVCAAAVSLLFGGVGLFVAFVPALLAVIFGFVGVNTANRMSGLRKRLAVWSVGLGFLALALPWLRMALFGI